MGSFSFTCWLSDLTISAGDEVKYFWLTDNPYDKRHMCSKHDMWFPRTSIIDGRYNSYGSIDGYDEEGPGVVSALMGLERDMVEQGTGDNQCHDVPTNRSMDFEAALAGVQEGRIVVSREIEDLYGSSEQYVAPDWRPTLQNITEFLQKSGYAVNNGDYSDEKNLLVDEQQKGWVRIRGGGFGESCDLIPIRDDLRARFAACITPGRDSWRNEIQVFPKPGNPEDEEHRSFRYNKPGSGYDKSEPLRVWQCMIHKCVWDHIIANNGFAKRRKEIGRTWDRNVARYTPMPTIETDDPKLRALLDKCESIANRDVLGMSGRSHVPYTMGITEHFELAAKRHAEQPFTEEQVEIYLDNVAGFHCVMNAIGTLRVWYRPSFSCGPQCGDFDAHIRWEQMCLEMAKLLQKREQERHQKRRSK